MYSAVNSFSLLCILVTDSFWLYIPTCILPNGADITPTEQTSLVYQYFVQSSCVYTRRLLYHMSMSCLICCALNSPRLLFEWHLMSIRRLCDYVNSFSRADWLFNYQRKLIAFVLQCTVFNGFFLFHDIPTGDLSMIYDLPVWGFSHTHFIYSLTSFDYTCWSWTDIKFIAECCIKNVGHDCRWRMLSCASVSNFWTIFFVYFYNFVVHRTSSFNCYLVSYNRIWYFYLWSNIKNFLHELLRSHVYSCLTMCDTCKEMIVSPWPWRLLQICLRIEFETQRCSLLERSDSIASLDLRFCARLGHW